MQFFLWCSTGTAQTLWCFIPLTTGPDYIRFFSFLLALQIPALSTLKIKRGINQQNFKIIDLDIFKSKQFSPTWSCGSRQRDTASSWWKFQFINAERIRGCKRHTTMGLRMLTLVLVTCFIHFKLKLLTLFAAWNDKKNISIDEKQPPSKLYFY